MREMESQLARIIPDEKTPNEDRLVMLCDGVFAIAATLLVLDIGINPGRFGPKQIGRASCRATV